MRARPSTARPRRAGFTLLDVCVSLLILVIALGTLLGSVFSSLRLSEVSESTAAANQALRGILEEMNAMPLDQVLAAYNSDSQDDPDPELDRQERLRVGEIRSGQGNGECAVAEVRFAGLDPDTGELRQELELPALGSPRDQDGDGQIDLLPVSVRLEWEGPSGKQVLELATLLRR